MSVESAVVMVNESVTYTDQLEERCPECDGHASGAWEKTCDDCGLVVDEYYIDHSPDWGPADHTPQYETSCRAGQPYTERLHDNGLRARLPTQRDLTANASPEMSAVFNRLRAMHRLSIFDSKRERSLAQGLGEVKRIASVLDLGHCAVDRACRLFHDAQDEGLLRGRSVDAIAAASVVAACREHSLLVPIDDVAEVTQYTERDVWRAYGTLSHELGLAAKTTTPAQYIAQVGSELDASNELRARAQYVARQLDQCDVAGRDPRAVAGGCYEYANLAVGDVVTQAEIADAAHSSAVTIRTHREHLAELGIDNTAAEQTAD